MTTTDVIEDVEAIYDQHIKKLSVEARLRLLALVASNLANSASLPTQSKDGAKGTATEPQQRSIMDLHGLGAEIWEGIDAQEYVNQLRSEWDHRP